MNNLTPEGRGLSNLLGIDRVADPLRQLHGERQQPQQTGFCAQHPSFRLAHLPLWGEVPRQFAFPIIFDAETSSHLTPGLANSLTGRVGISAYLPRSVAPAQSTARRPLLYHKNGVLVGHAGRPISAEDVADALAEE